MVDKTLILRKLSALDEYLDQISEYAYITLETYAGDWKTQRIVERTLQMMIETCLDISGHIISDQKLRMPETYADIFKEMHRLGVVDQDFMQRLIKMVKFRNRLVHLYWELDRETIFDFLQNNLDDFTLFQNKVVDFLNKNKL